MMRNSLMKKCFFLTNGFFPIIFFLVPYAVAGQASQPTWQSEWDRTLEAAKTEGKVVVSVPASAELRKGLEDGFKKRFGIEAETVVARGASAVRKIVEEGRSGIRYFDVHLGGSESIVTGMLPEGILEPIEPWLILPDVKDPKNWWGGHIWIDNAKRFVYSFLAYQTENIWYNADLMKPEEVRSFDDLLLPKWLGKIGYLDPRTPGSGASFWSYMWYLKGEAYLKRLADQKMLISRDQRLLAENLAKGKTHLTIGLTFYSFQPFFRAGLPVKPLPTPKEGVYVSGGSGHLTIMKNLPHPNAAKVFVNWLLSKEGQAIFGRAMGMGTRRYDVDTKWLKEAGVVAAKDIITVDQYYKLENQSEEKINKIREPAAAVARKLLD
ncbi:extracellular solute-binding protein [bacterium]|nr:MAG: extracellular solute-binding protein [bacterium]